MNEKHLYKISCALKFKVALSGFFVSIRRIRGIQFTLKALGLLKTQYITQCINKKYSYYIHIHDFQHSFEKYINFQQRMKYTDCLKSLLFGNPGKKIFKEQ